MTDPVPPRKYSLEELDMMRRSITFIHWSPTDSYNPHDRLMAVESLLRTHMLNGSSPDELARQASEVYTRRDLPMLKALQCPEYIRNFIAEHFKLAGNIPT